MKTNALPIFLCAITALLLVSFSDPYTIKRVSDANFRYEFYTTSKKVNPKENKQYYWFKGGVVHKAQSGIAGELLNDKFVKMYHSNQLAEQGTFRNGLKIGLWKTWYENGIVETTQKWSRGLQTGEFFRFSNDGSIVEKGNFKKGKKHGKWIDYIKKDTVLYKRGVVFVEKVRLSKAERAKIRLEKKESKNKEKDGEKSKAALENKTKKEGFFKRIIGKKEPKQNLNG